ncbi:motility protein A [Paeniglutamicibacter psychrophenolicus]|uniref:motility protein A n=1 Tax=Paeniglutamicibacter psychrophenolicus TaxID=257454 RepID=UPI0027866266|nr:MotA/TolQ/ExbB proton channel family protein [Paeniglutamicibacter psychrophenolicus]MDQ0094634.1 chemotaxis protein MotA [Paeniglutamicibacter psychrophenolicus]
MDPATLIGLLLAFGAMFTMLYMEGASVSSILLPAPMIIVFFGTIAVGIASGTIADTVLAVRALPSAFRGKLPEARATIAKLVELAEVARKDGLLALESEARDAKDPFLGRALQSLADGMDGDELRETLEDEITTRETTNAIAHKWFSTLGGYAPTVGIIGTVVSLTHVLENLSKPDELGHMIAAAFVATLWGLVSANFIWLPIGSRLRRLSELEIDSMTLVMEGVLAIQGGSQPILLEEKLQAMVPAHALGKGKAKDSGPGALLDDFKEAA